MTKRRILKVSKNLKDGEDYKHVNINEDLTKTRNSIAYRARQLKNRKYIAQTWTVDGKIFIKFKNEQIITVTTDRALKQIIADNFPGAMNVAYPPPKKETYAAAAAPHSEDGH